MQQVPFIILLYVSALIALALLAVAWRRRTVVGATAFGVLVLACAWWTVAYILSLSTTQWSASLCWNYVCWPGVVTMPVAWLYFTLQYTGREVKVTRAVLGVLLILPAISLLLVGTGDAHHLIYARTCMATIGRHSVLITVPGSWFWVQTAYSYALILAGVACLIFHALHTSPLYRGQAMILLASALPPIVCNLLYLCSVFPLDGLNLTPFSFALSGVLIGFGLFYYRFLNLSPIASTAVVAGMSDGVIVLDLAARIVDVNPYALAALRRLDGEILGHSIVEVLADMPEIIAQFGAALEARAVVPVSRDQTLNYYDVRISPIADRRQRLVGRLIVFRDITERVSIERALRESEETTRVLLNATTETALLVDRHGKVLAVNDNLAHLMRQPSDAMIGRPVSQSVPPELFDDHLRHAEHVFRTGKSARYSIAYQGRWYTTTMSPILDTGGQVIRLAVFSRDITEQKQLEDRLNQLAYFDQLTALPNRFMLQDRLEQALARMKRQDTSAVLLFIDLDNFKAINDRLGHDAGDNLLREMAWRLRRSVRESDTVSRMGGDEFVVLLSDCRQPHEEAQITINRIQAALAEPISYHQELLHLSASIGVAIAPDDGVTPEELLRRADQAMYRAKEQGRNTFRYFTDDVRALYTERRALEDALRQALDQQNLQLYFQPQCDFHSDRIIGVEALLRWRHPQFGLIPPMQFLPAAEDTNMAEEIGAWVLRTASAQMADWLATGQTSLKLAVNISPRQFEDHRIVQIVEQALRESGLPPTSLELELSEGLVLRGAQQTVTTMRQLRELGVQLAIDNIGIGHYSVNYLRQMPLTTLKIDGSFIRDIADDLGSVATVRTIIDLGHHLGLTIVAECVETSQQYDVLQSLGCDQFQGYLFSRPLPADDCDRLFGQRLHV